MWNVKRWVISVIITGTISKSFRKYMSNRSRSKGTTEDCHIGHCTHTSESADVKGHQSQWRNK
jgi:hypothetical protein